jgi:hypothetical protein
MILTEYEVTGTGQDFLLLNYDDMDFIVNRSQFSGSTSLNDVKKVKSPLPYIKSIFPYNSSKILLFDCDSFLRETYNSEKHSSSHLCLLMGMENFSLKVRSLVKRVLKGNESLSQEYLGLIITSQSEIKRLKINEIHLSPRGVRSVLNSNGLYGCRFPREDRIQYFIDLEIIIHNIILGRNR